MLNTLSRSLALPVACLLSLAPSISKTDELTFRDGSKIYGKILSAEAGTIVVETVLLRVDQVDQINPEPWQLGYGYTWFGSTSTAVQLESGNTEAEELDFDLQSTWRNKYDYFLKDMDNHVGGMVAFEADEFADLDLRTIAGPYLGRQFYDSRYISVQGELGLVYVDQQFAMEENNRYPGGNWAFHLTSDYLGGSSTFYIDHDGVMNFESSDELLLNTVIGLSIPIFGKLEAGAELKFKYDGSVADEVEELDKTFKLRLAYTW